MKRAGVLLAVMSVVALCAWPVQAAEIEKGTVEVTTQSFFSYASYSPDSGSDVTVTTINIDAGVGYFATSLLEVMGGIVVLHQGLDEEGGGSFSTTDFGVAGALRLNFATSGTAVPFLGAGLGIVTHGGDTDNDETTLIAPSVEAGVRFLVGSSASVNMALGYQFRSNALGVKDVSGNIILLGVGISAFASGGPM
jgi:hypothetical protein